MTDFDDLIPEMREWNNGTGIDIRSWIGCMGNFRLAIGYSTVFWPQFVEFEHFVLWEGFSLKSLRGFEVQCNGDRQRVEGLMNHLHIADIQFQGCEDITPERVVHLGRVLRDIYRAKLAWQFPSKRFDVHFDELPAQRLTDYVLTFVQI